MLIEGGERPSAHLRLKRLKLDVAGRFTLRQRLLFLLLLASVPGMVVAAFLAVNALANQSEQIETSAKRLAIIQAGQHTNVIDNARVMLDTLVETLSLRDVEQAECQTFLMSWAERYLSFTSLTLLDAEGQIVCSSVETDMPALTAEEDFFTRAMAERAFVVGEYAVGRTGKPLIVAARPIFDGSEQVTGAVAVGIDLRWLEFLARRMELPPGSTVTAMGRNGDVLNHYMAEVPGEERAAASRETLPSESLRREMATLADGVLRGWTEAGNRRVYGFQRTDAGGLVIAVGMLEFLEFERYGAALRDTLMSPMAILLLALVAAGYASEALVTRWVRMLTGAAARMQKGDLAARSNVPHSRYEIGRLAAAFDTMAAAIQREQKMLRSMIEQRQALLRELNHRVKNNLQLITSLISIRSRALTDASARGVLSDVVDRVRALSEIHNLLYGERSDGMVPADFTARLAERLAEFYGTEQCRVEVAAAPVPLPPDHAVTLGLIMNELIANACKHAFPDRAGTVKVELRVSGERADLSVADDGAPLPGDFDTHLQGGSLGLKMVDGMARQLNGEVALEHEGQWKTFRLRFPLTGPDPTGVTAAPETGFTGD
jgi:two-component sensor histidine kinase